MWLKGPNGPLLGAQSSDLSLLSPSLGQVITHAHTIFSPHWPWITRGFPGFLRKSWKIKRITEKHRQDLQQLSCRDLLYKGQATEELSVNIHFIHSSNTHSMQWSYLCLMLCMFITRRLKVSRLINQHLQITSPDEQPSTLSIRWVSANKYKLNWKRTETLKIAGTDSTLQSTRYWTGILMLLQLGETTDIETQPQPRT